MHVTRYTQLRKGTLAGHINPQSELLALCHGMLQTYMEQLPHRGETKDGYQAHLALLDCWGGGAYSA